jgi:hypothetical protein
VRVRWEGGETFAVTYDASDRGVLMLTADPVPVGAVVAVTFDVPGEPGAGPASTPRAAAGRVVRGGLNEDDPHGLWPHRVAVALDEALEAFSAELGRLAREHPLAEPRRS